MPEPIPRAQMATSGMRCSFCNKPHRDVRKLIAGPAANICDECIAVCQDIIADDPQSTASGGAAEEPRAVNPPPLARSTAAATCTLCRLPMLVDQGLWIAHRGILCQGCISAVADALAEVD